MSDTNISVQVADGEAQYCPPNTPAGALAESATDSGTGLPLLGALVNNDTCSLSFPLQVNSRVEYLTFAHRLGARIFRRSLCFLLAKVAHDLFPEGQLHVEHSLGTGYFCRFDDPGGAGFPKEDLARLEIELQELVRRDLPIQRRMISFEDAVAQLTAEGQQDKLNLLRYRNPPRITLWSCEDFSDLGHGVMAPSTGTLTPFKLIPYPPGFVLQFPEWNADQLSLPPFKQQPHLFNIFQERKAWGKIIGNNTVGDLNQTVAQHHLPDLVAISEALQEKKIGQVADEIARRRSEGPLRWVLIAGPSSSGKTTFSRRLAIHLKVNGLRTVNIECDNYFHDRTQTPRDANGEYDFEHLESIDLELLNRHLLQLEAGEEIEVPHYNFETGRQEFNGDLLRLEPDQVAIIEGIHGLNPRLTDHIPADHKYLIYISALTQLQVDRNNRLSTTDLRLIRRMVRDNIYRGNNALATLKMWPSVRRGEKQWIFPYQKEADIAFNSSLDYELAILKNYATPLLAEVKPSQPEYAEARRLQAFLNLILSNTDDCVPPSSLLREFIGGSALQK